MTKRERSSLVLCIDLGSSSVRCSLYQLGSDQGDHDTTATTTTTPLTTSSSVQVLDDTLSTSRAWQAVDPQTGKLCLYTLQNHDDNVIGSSSSRSTTTSLFDVVDECIDETLHKLQNWMKEPQQQQQHSASSFSIVAVGFSELVMNLIGVDVHGTPIGPDATCSYACNLPSVAHQVQVMKQQLSSWQDGKQDELYAKTGTPLHAAYALPQLKSFYQDHATQASRVACWQTLASLCLARWCTQSKTGAQEQGGGGGEGDYYIRTASWPISYSEASWTGLLNTTTCQYEPAVLELLPDACRAALPELMDFNAMAGTGSSLSSLSTILRMRSCYAQRWPRLQGAHFFLGLGDGACANVGSKCTTTDRIACTIGTSAATRVVIPAASHATTSTTTTSTLTVPPGLFCYRINQDYLLLGGALTDGGSVVAWIRELLNIQSDTDMEECLTQVEELLVQNYAECSSSSLLHQSTPLSFPQRPLVMLPFLSGERSTNFQTGATGAMVGLTRSTTRAHMVKACLEGVTMRLAAITRLLSQSQSKSENTTTATTTLPEIWVSGKALEVNHVWRQMIADCTGHVVVLDQDTTEGSSRGVACLIGACLFSAGGAMKLPIENASNVVKTLPRPEGQGYWEQLTRAQESLVDAMRPIYAG